MAPELDSDDSDVGEGGHRGDWNKYKVRSQINEGYNSSQKKRDIIDTFFTYVNRDLLICKLFYFFFFAAFGSLFPLLAIYFKQLGMNPTQSGILIGFRPFVEFCSAPFWGSLADKYKKGKHLMLFSLFCWIVFTLSIAFVKPPPHHCVESNITYKVQSPPGYVARDSVLRGRRSIDLGHEADDETFPKLPNLDKRMEMNKSEGVSYSVPGKVTKGNTDDYVKFKPLTSKSPAKTTVQVKPTQKTQLSHAIPTTVTMPHDAATAKSGAADAPKGSYIKPKYSTVYYEKHAVQDVFFTLLLLVVIGEFFSAPAITFADSVTLAYLGDDTDNYGRQRMFGSLGWGFSMFFVGLALDQSTTFPNHPCGLQHQAEKDYTICFAVFSVLMSCALFTATQLIFDHRHGGGKDFQLVEFVEKVKDRVMETITGKRPLDRGSLFRDEEDDDIDYLESKATMQKQMETGQAVDPFKEDDPNKLQQPNGNGKNIQISLETRQDMVSDVTKKPVSITGQDDDDDEPFLGRWIAVMRMLSTYKYITVLFVSWFMGFGIGLIFTFLFWHLQDLGGSPTLFGVASVFNHISELLAYFLSRRLISRIGHIRVLYAGLLGNVVRFMYISWLKSPWWVLPFEFVQGLTHAAVWAACCSYITQAIPTGLRSSAQGILQGLHHGLGRGCGAVFGGIMVYSYGAETTFRAYGVTCLILLILYIVMNFFIVDHGKFSFGSRDKHEILEEEDNMCHLAPHGVPSGMARDLSSSKLREEGMTNYGATSGYVPNGPGDDFYPDNFDNDTQRITINEPPAMATQVYQQQPYNTFDQRYGP
ncbi:major facilitator superfamily domain-containing protein 6-like [Argopecten irradians]|uniref:major facilitator superfamily domain-containing protein 6-like n=1 Tax=Argopecten irradians TaxID=31199 RepID=UPI003719056F